MRIPGRMPGACVHQTSKFPTTSEFPTELPTHMASGSPGCPALQANHSKVSGGPVFKAHRLVYHSTLGLSVKKEEKRSQASVHRLQGYIAHKKLPPPRTLQ